MINLDGLTTHETRNIMLGHGWDSNDNLGLSSGKPCYTIWFNRWNWHGKHCDRITFYQVAIAPMFNDIPSAVKRAAILALNAWDTFTDCIPYQDINGNVVKDINRTNLVYERDLNEASES